MISLIWKLLFIIYILISLFVKYFFYKSDFPHLIRIDFMVFIIPLIFYLICFVVKIEKSPPLKQILQIIIVIFTWNNVLLYFIDMIYKLNFISNSNNAALNVKWNVVNYLYFLHIPALILIFIPSSFVFKYFKYRKIP